MLLPVPPTRIVDEDAAHQASGDGEEVRTVLPIDPALVDQLQVDLVDERGRLRRAVRPLAGEMACGNDVQLVVDERDEPVQCLAAAPPANRAGAE